MKETLLKLLLVFCVGRKLAKKRKETLSSRQEMTLMVNSSQHTTMVDAHAHTLNGRSEYMHVTRTNAAAVWRVRQNESGARDQET